MKLTIDANLINARGNLDEMNTLERWREEGKLQLVGTQRLEDEVARHPMQPEASDKVSQMENISEPGVWGVSKWGKCKWGANEKVGFKDLAAILFPDVNAQNLNENQQNDVMHLLSHTHSGSAIFITNNTKDFIDGGRQEQLNRDWNIVVMSATEAVGFLSTQYGWSMS